MLKSLPSEEIQAAHAEVQGAAPSNRVEAKEAENTLKEELEKMKGEMMTALVCDERFVFPFSNVVSRIPLLFAM